MTLVETLFSFEGRIPRRVYWGYSLALGAAFYAAVIALVVIFGEESPIAGIVMVLLYLPLLWTSLALQVKRWHDRDKSGWMCLIGLIPIIGAIWAFVEIGLLRGTEGRNSFGADPT